VSEFDISDIVTDSEQRFPFPDLLTCEYFQIHRRRYYTAREKGLLNPYRNYVELLTFLTEVNEYNPQHGKSFTKRLRETSKDWRNSEAIFAEVIVYRHYIRATHEGLIRSIGLSQAESDIIIERPDGSKAFLEVFCVMPNFHQPEAQGIVVRDVKTHTQTEVASIRQKLLRKISKQKQLSKPRENYAVVELNDVTIAGDFSVLSSLSSGYTVRINKETMQVVSAGYDWSASVFDDPSTEFLKGVIYFSLGDYGSRKFLFNPKFCATTPNQGLQGTLGSGASSCP
jgi:hypothetical protein